MIFSCKALLISDDSIFSTFYAVLSGLHRRVSHLQLAVLSVPAVLLLAADWQLGEVLGFPEQ